MQQADPRQKDYRETAKITEVFAYGFGVMEPMTLKLNLNLLNL